MNIDDKKSFQSFTNHLIDDFQDYLPFTTLCKLHVIDCHLQDMTNNDITNSLANFAEKIKNNKKNIHITKRSDEEIDKDNKSLERYSKSHQKKLSRLKEISSIPELLKIIGYENFIHAIIEKYPFPPIAGFSSHRWTKELLYKYIYLYFDISKFEDKADIPLPALNTIRDALHYPPIKYPYIISPFKFSYKWLFSYYIKKPVDFYFVLMTKKPYEISPTDKKRPHKIHRYDESFFASLIRLSDFSIPSKPFRSFSYSAQSAEESVNLAYCFNKLYEIAIQHSKKFHSNSDYTIVFLVREGNFKQEFNDYSDDLWTCPNYSLITFRNIETIIKTLKKLENNLKKITSENKDSANEYNKEYNVVNEIRRNITAVKDNLPFLSNLPLETRNDMAEYNLKTKNALRLIVKDQNKIFEEKEITIRFATSYDLKFIKENYEKLSKSNEVFYSSITNNDDEPKQFKPLSNKYWKNLINKINGFILIGLYYQKKRGFIVIKGISKHECRLIYLYVDEYYRQKGIGKHLLSEAKNTAKQLGYTKISLYVLSNNEIAQSLYKNSNFETTKLRMECSLNE